MFRSMLPLALIAYSSLGHAQTFDERQRQLYDQQARAHEQAQVERYQAQNQTLAQAAQVFASQRGESVTSGPSCPTIISEEPITSFWPNSLAARSRDSYKNTAAKRCDFSTSGGSVCKSEYALLFSKQDIAGLGVRIDCITGQTSESFKFRNGRVVKWDSEIGSAEAKPRRRR